MLMIKKRERDMLDNRKKIRMAKDKNNRYNKGVSSVSQPNLETNEDIKIVNEPSRIVTSFLPRAQ